MPECNYGNEEFCELLKAARNEAAAYRAVLEGMEFENIETLAERGVEFCRELGQAAAVLTKNAKGIAHATEVAYHIHVKQIRRLMMELATLTAALEFYADPDTYFAIGFFPDTPNGPFMDDFSETELGMKPGVKARAALAEVERLKRSKEV